jgi:hypothetical protein
MYAVGIVSCGITYIPSLMKNGTGVKKYQSLPLQFERL